MLNLLVLLIFVNLVCGLVVFRARNPVLSAFYLIFMYIIASILLYCYYLEFFGYIYVIVYIGAIFVLFLIIVMLTSTSVLVRMYVEESVLILLLVVLVAGFV
jgi:NADH-quinone oxidoreductase subunit J